MKEIIENEYNKQAEDFLKKIGTTFKAEFVKHDKHFADDKENRDIYKITLTRGERVFSFNFGQSIADSGFKIINTNTNKEVKYIWFSECLQSINHILGEKERQTAIRKFVLNKFVSMGCLKIIFGSMPSAYDVLAGLTDYEVGDFQEFCDNFGYDNDSIKAEKIYKAVVEEYKQVCMLWNEKELEELREIN